MSALLVLALCLSLAPTAALADEPAEAPESALTEETALPEDGTTEEPLPEPEEPVYAELVELPPIETSAWPGISLWSLTNGQVDLADGKHEKWIDRIDVPDYAKDFYAALENGAKDGGVLIDPTKATQKIFNYEDGTSETGYFIEIDCGTDDPTYALKCVTAAYHAFDRDHPEVFWLGNFQHTVRSISSNGNAVYFALKTESGFDIRQTAYQDAQVIQTAIIERNSNVQAILNACPATGTYEKIRQFNEWLTHNNEYNTYVSGIESGTAPKSAWECTSALAGSIGGEGPVCEGYARAFKVLCDEVGIPCVLVDGHAKNSTDSDGEAHMWNYVQMDDGNWYAVDVTWNDPVYYDVSGNPKRGSGVWRREGRLAAGGRHDRGREYGIP